MTGNKPLTPAQARKKLQNGLIDCLTGNNPRPIDFRLKRAKKFDQLYPLKLTSQQRESLLRCTNLSPGLKTKIKNIGKGTRAIYVSRTELNKLNDETGQAAIYARSPDRNRLLAIQRQAIKRFEEEVAEVFDGLGL